MKKIFYICLFFFVINIQAQNPIKLSSDFPGGNIDIIKISGDTAWVKTDTTGCQSYWFYWYFKVSNLKEKTFTFKFQHDHSLHAVSGPAYSINNNHSWQWLGKDKLNGSSFTVSFSADDSIAFFALAPPYVEDNFQAFLSNLSNKQNLDIGVLCTTPEGRNVEKIIIPSNGDPQYKMLITARHHACEMMASYVLEGIIDGILNDKRLDYLRENVEFMVIPFMDKDGVENGEQGKLRIPWDHNRDYKEGAIHNSTKAVMKQVPIWGEDKLKLALDLHCPYITDSKIFVVGSPYPEIEKNQIIFSKLLEKNSTGELKFYHKDFHPYGLTWNSTQNTSFSNWAGALKGISLALSFEFPYSIASGVLVTPDGAREFGKTIAYSIQNYFQQMDHKD